MEHLFHFMVPGTPENLALVRMAPALAPMQAQLADLLARFRGLFR
jgi:hypothetical protein